MSMRMNGWFGGGGRVPVSYNLRAGQFRGGFDRVNYHSTTNYINIYNNNSHSCCNGGGYDFDYGCQQQDIPAWQKWLIGGGMGLSFLGGILDLFKKEPKVDDTKVKVQPDNSELDDLKKQLADAKKEIEEMKKTKEQESQQEVEHDTPVDEGRGALTPKPKLFNAATMANFADADAVIAAFNKQTDSTAYKISSAGGPITITTVSDDGNGTNQTGSVTISAEQLKSLEDGGVGTKLSVGDFHGKPVIAENLDGYLRIKVGNEQTYIVGKKADGKYEGFQFENGNVDGRGDFNWRRGGGVDSSSNTPKGSGGIVPKGWGRNQEVSSHFAAFTKAKNSPMKTAQHVLSDLKLPAGSKVSVEDFAKANPSVFEQNAPYNIKEGADWSKLDVPKDATVVTDKGAKGAKGTTAATNSGAKQTQVKGKLNYNFATNMFEASVTIGGETIKVQRASSKNGLDRTQANMLLSGELNNKAKELGQNVFVLLE